VTNEEAVVVLQGMMDKLSRAGASKEAQALRWGEMALLALGDIPIAEAAAEIHRLRHVDRQFARWMPASHKDILEWGDDE